jgi:phosphatidylserine/phosphatidylglycerophosphate/cardiolipin synthase-like enzyme
MNRLKIALSALCLIATALPLSQAKAVVPAAAPAPYRIQALYENSRELPTIQFVGMAKKTIDIEIYEMDDPVFRQALRTALKNHVRIRVVKEPEPINAKCLYFGPNRPIDSPSCADEKKLMLEIVHAGGAVVPFNKAFCPAWIEGKCLEHGKLILIDAGIPMSQAALISSGNFNSSNFCDPNANPAVCNRDYTLITKDPEVIGTLSVIFQKDMAGVPYNLQTVLTPSVSQKLTVSPLSQAPLVAFIRSAKSVIVVQNQYLHEKQINQALIEMAQKGVKVYVNVASLCAFGPPTPDSLDLSNPKSNAAIMTAFEQAGIQVRMFSGAQTINGKIGYLHAKAILIDNNRAWMGSVNGSSPGTSANREFGLFFNDPLIVNHLSQVMHYDFVDPRGETWQESAKCLRDPPRPGGED